MHSGYAVDGLTLHDAPGFTLHPVRGAVWAAFWGSPIAAGIVMAINYSRMGRTTAARVMVLAAIAATVALVGLVFAIPEDVHIPTAAFLVPQLLAVYAIANALQGDRIRSHAAQGGTVASAWPSVGIGLLCLPFVLGAIFGTALLLEPSFGTVIDFGNDEICYSAEATEEDARKLARVLQEIEFFGSGGASVRLECRSAQYTVSFVLVEDAWKDPEIVDAFRDIGRTLAASGFRTPLTVQWCDD
jgi:hypothetical protein